MITIINRLLSLTWIGDVAEYINGRKTLLGVFALVLHMLNIVPDYMPAYGMTVDYAAYIQQALLYMGVLLPVGVAHKVGKAVEEIV
jgi:hypothetical protein